MPLTTKAIGYKAGLTAVAEYASRLDGLEQTALAAWAADCAEHALSHFERKHPTDRRPRAAVEAAHLPGHARAAAAYAVTAAAGAATAGVGAAIASERDWQIERLPTNRNPHSGTR